MSQYKSRLTKDLDRWIEDGLVPESARAPILESITERPRLEAANALAIIGAGLLGLAAIAFVAANWDGIPRVVRYGLICALFGAAAFGAAWTSARRLTLATEALVVLASLIFAAAIGLVGQIFDLAGDPQVACYGAAGAAALLALAGRSSGAAIVALGLAALGDVSATAWSEPWILADGACAVAATAIWWRSAVLAHAAGIAVIAGAVEVVARLSSNFDQPYWAPAVVAAALFAGLAYFARSRGEGLGRIFYGWLALAGLIALGIAGGQATDAWKAVHRIALVAGSCGVVVLGRRDKIGAVQVVGWLGFWFAAVWTGLDVGFGDHVHRIWRIAHRLMCLAGAAGLIALARHDRNNWITGVGMVLMLATAAMVFNDFGLSLMAAAGVFGLSAVVILAVGGILRRRAGA